MSSEGERRPLPRELVAPARYRDVAWVTLVPLCIVLLLNFAVALTLQVHPSNRGDWLVRAKWQLLQDLKRPVSTLVLGDSTCNQGIDPEEMSRVLGGPTLNLCTTGDKLAVLDAWMLEAYVKRFGAPKRVLVMHAYDVWARDENTFRKVAWTMSPYSALFDAAKPTIDWTLGEALLMRIGAWVPLYNQPQASLEVLSAPVSAWTRTPYALGRSGFMAYDKPNPKRVARDAKSHMRSVQSERTAVSSINRRALEAMLSITREHKTRLYLAHSPMFEGLWQDRAMRRQHKAVTRTLEAQLTTSPSARLLSRVPERFSADEMENADHVVGPAATRLSQQVSAQILQVEQAEQSAQPTQ